LESSTVWSGWVGFAGVMMLLMGALDAIEGLVALLHREFYVETPQQLLVFDLNTWGWISLFWGLFVAFAGFALLRREGWARWFTSIAGTLSVIVQLGFVGSSTYPLIALAALSVNIVVLYALIVRWDDVRDDGF
jgi:hypothetical protein